MATRQQQKNLQYGKKEFNIKQMITRTESDSFGTQIPLRYLPALFMMTTRKQFIVLKSALVRQAQLTQYPRSTQLVQLPRLTQYLQWNLPMRVNYARRSFTLTKFVVMKINALRHSRTRRMTVTASTLRQSLRRSRRLLLLLLRLQ